jgi:hypothetical protein
MNVLQHTTPVLPAQTVPRNQAVSFQVQDVDMTLDAPTTVSAGLKQPPAFPSPVKPKLSINTEGVEVESLEVIMTDVKAERAADSDIAETIDNGKDVTMSNKERDTTESEKKAVTKDGNLSGSSACPSNQNLTAASTDSDMADGHFANTNDTKIDDSPRSFSLSGAAFQAALLEEIKEVFVVKMDTLVSEQPWLATFRLANKGFAGWETALAAEVLKQEFSSFICGVDKDL